MALVLENNGSDVALAIKESLKRREIDLLNPILMAAIVIDIESIGLLSADVDPEKNELAKNTIVSLGLKIAGLELELTDNSVFKDNSHEIGTLTDTDSDEDMAILRKSKSSGSQDDIETEILPGIGRWRWRAFSDWSATRKTRPPLATTTTTSYSAPSLKHQVCE